MLPKMICFDKLSPKTATMYNRFRSLPRHAIHLAESLDSLDALLEEYELHDLAYSKSYRKLLKQWRVLERTFYKVLKSLTYVPPMV